MCELVYPRMDVEKLTSVAHTMHALLASLLSRY